MTEAIKRAEEKAIAALCHPEHPMLQRVTTAILDARNEGRIGGLEEAAVEADRHGDPQIRDAIEALKVKT